MARLLLRAKGAGLGEARAAAPKPPVPKGGGAALGAEVRADEERRFGHSFADVRVHSGADADASARALGASAFTVGRDIVFRAGAFAPETAAGRGLLAHELTHVVQADRGPREATAEGAPLELSEPDDALEHEADRAAGAALARGAAPAAVVGRAPASLVARKTDPVEQSFTTGIALDPAQMTKWQSWSYWEQKVLEVYRLAMNTISDAEKRDAVLSVLWNEHVKLGAFTAATTRVVSIPARAGAASSKALLCKFVFTPKSGTETKPKVEVSVEAEGAGAAAVAAPAGPGTAPSSFSYGGFPGNKYEAYWAGRADEEGQLYKWIEDAPVGSLDQIITTHHTPTGKEPPHDSTLHVTGTKDASGTSVTIILVGETTPAAGAVPAAYAAHDYGDLALEGLQGKAKDKLGNVTGVDTLPADERLPVKNAIWQYYQGGARNAEIDIILPLPGSPARRIFYTLRFRPTSNDVDVERVGEEGKVGTVDRSKVTFDIGRCPDFAANSADVTALKAWLAKRFPSLTPKGADVAAMRAAANKDIEAAAGTSAWFKATYGMEVLDPAAAVTRMTTAHTWDARQTADMKAFTAEELKVVELGLETMSGPLLALLKNIPLARQTVFIEKSGSGKATTYTPKPKTGGLTVTNTTTVTSGTTTTTTSERTILIFDNATINDDRLFLGGTSGGVTSVLPSSTATMIHEAGHAIGGQAGIQAAFNKKFVDAGAALKKAPVTWYAATGTGEFFPEAFALYNGDPAWMKTNIPDMFTWFEALSKTGSPPP